MDGRSSVVADRSTLPLMKRQSSRGSRERVEAARRQAQLALGKDPDAPDDRAASSQHRSPQNQPSSPTPIARDTSVGVLLIGEAASRLGMNRAELEAMIARGDVDTFDRIRVRGPDARGRAPAADAH